MIFRILQRYVTHYIIHIIYIKYLNISIEFLKKFLINLNEFMLCKDNDSKDIIKKRVLEIVMKLFMHIIKKYYN